MNVITVHMGRLMFAGLTLIGGVALSLKWQSDAIAYAKFPPRELATLVARPGAEPFPDGFVQQARQMVAKDPLDQKRFNAYYTYKALTGTVPEQAQFGRQLLARLGWRDTSAQMNLIYAAALVGDYDTVIERSDALLRRSVASGEILDILFQLERLPAWRKPLVDRLAANPGWRREFLVNDHGYSDEAAAKSRKSTLAAMLRTASPATPREVAPMVYQLAQRGDEQGAYAIWRGATSKWSSRGGMLFDPSFSFAATHPDTLYQGEGNSAKPSPFAWKFNNGLGHTAAVVDNGRLSGVELSWEAAAGAAALLSQQYKASAPPRLIRLTGPNAEIAIMQQLSFQIKCGSESAFFDRVIEKKPNILDIGSSTLLSCSFPVLTVSPNAAVVGGAVGRAYFESINVF